MSGAGGARDGARRGSSGARPAPGRDRRGGSGSRPAGRDTRTRSTRSGPAPAARPRGRHAMRRAIALVATAVVVVLGVSAGGWWALSRFGPGVDQVEIAGTRQIPQRDVSDAAAVDPGTPLAAVDTDAVASRVSAIPGVATVDVGRSWPHTLTVTVTERTPAGVIDTPGGRKLVDVNGFAYRTAPPTAKLPVLALPRVAPDDPATHGAVAVLQALPPQIRGQVETVVLGAGGSTVELTLSGNRRVLFGPWADTADPAATQRRAVALGPLLSREGSVYDVSSPDLVTVRR
ncbi:cell division protein FtsQ/DivIB [Pseudonocardia phyllosphaerae]|uniref:cell division protein FtsQ/DivIB n=1 Tax=Pseudonocardia phyllosphaerae TaxID=3390502 RepID=UPI0039799D7F